MKFFYLRIALLIFILNGCSSDQKSAPVSNEEFKVDVEKINHPEGKLKLSAHLGGSHYDGQNNIIYIAATIENLTGDTIRFLSWNCSYENMFVVDDPMNFKIQSRNDCFDNIPMFFYLPPFMKTDRYLMIKELRGEHVKAIKIGMKLIIQTKELEEGRMIENYANSKEHAIIWSNELQLSRFYKDFYR